jgi:hypothetical protein
VQKIKQVGHAGEPLIFLRSIAWMWLMIASAVSQQAQLASS